MLPLEKYCNLIGQEGRADQNDKYYYITLKQASSGI